MDTHEENSEENYTYKNSPSYDYFRERGNGQEIDIKDCRIINVDGGKYKFV